MTIPENTFIVCTQCFSHNGLRLDADRIGTENSDSCSNCGAVGHKKLTNDGLGTLAYRYFVWGSMMRTRYGGAPLIQFNELRDKTEVTFHSWLESDVKLIERLLCIGFFHYGPRFWMIGEIEPLKDLQLSKRRQPIIKRILTEYPTRILTKNDSFYRIRVNPNISDAISEYDSPPIQFSGHGRLDSKNQSILYGSQDLEVCIHECRVSAEDSVFVASLQPSRDLKLLDLSVLLVEGEGITEFESLDLTVHMLFLAGRHSYKLTRAIAEAASAAGFDGLIYPSYFSLLRLGNMPFETTLGMSHRTIQQLHEWEQSKTIPNLALFGHPVAEGKVEVKYIDRLIISHVAYDFHFGPVIR